MPLQVANKTVTVTDAETVLAGLKSALADKSMDNRAQVVFATWMCDTKTHSFVSLPALTTAVKMELGKRENYFFEQAGENLNIDTVIFKSEVPTDSIGWSEPQFFQELGHPGNRRWFSDHITSETLAKSMKLPLMAKYPSLVEVYRQGLRRRAEQEYLLQNMVKGALWDAAQVADKFKVGIAVRGTGLLAHMGIESGDPTKAQEFKNKTSKEIDLILCPELEASKLGSVVHYDPRVEWSSTAANAFANMGKCPMFMAPATKADWVKKKATIPARLMKLGKHIKVPSDTALEAAFMSRSKEYMEEDYEYRKGHYAPFTKLVGPYIRLQARPDVNMVGDHDLFAFTYPEADQYGTFLPGADPRVAQAQSALQNSQTFQAQHGGIWYWRPGVEFNVGIKNKIMGAHGPEGDEPLVYIRPGQQVTAAYYTTDDNLKSVWDDTTWTKWLNTTYTGKLL